MSRLITEIKLTEMLFQLAIDSHQRLFGNNRRPRLGMPGGHFFEEGDGLGRSNVLEQHDRALRPRPLSFDHSPRVSVDLGDPILGPPGTAVREEVEECARPQLDLFAFKPGWVALSSVRPPFAGAG